MVILSRWCIGEVLIGCLLYLDRRVSLRGEVRLVGRTWSNEYSHRDSTTYQQDAAYVIDKVR